MRPTRFFLAALVALAVFALPTITHAQTSASPPDISADSLRVALYALADDSMGGRQTGELGDWKAQEWIAAQFRRFGLQPAGDNGTFFRSEEHTSELQS